MLNIDDIRRRENVAIVDIADLLGVGSKTVTEKISGKREFKFNEAVKIKEAFFPAYDLIFLFSAKKVTEEA